MEGSILDSCFSRNYFSQVASSHILNRICWPAARGTNLRSRAFIRLESFSKSSSLRPSGAWTCWAHGTPARRCGDGGQHYGTQLSLRNASSKPRLPSLDAYLLTMRHPAQNGGIWQMNLNSAAPPVAAPCPASPARHWHRGHPGTVSGSSPGLALPLHTGLG